MNKQNGLGNIQADAPNEQVNIDAKNATNAERYELYKENRMEGEQNANIFARIVASYRQAQDGNFPNDRNIILNFYNNTLLNNIEYLKQINNLYNRQNNQNNPNL